MSMDGDALLAYKVEQMEESLRLTVQTKTGYRTLLYQARWLDRQIRSWLGGITGFCDRDSFVNFMISNHYIGCREVVEALFEKYKLVGGDEQDMIDIERFSTTIVNQSIQSKADTLRRSQGDIF